MNHWRALLLVYDGLDVTLPVDERIVRFRHRLTKSEREDALESFYAFPALARDVSNGAVGLSVQTVTIDRTLNSSSPLARDQWWCSPDDVRPELDRYGPIGKFDSLFVLWPMHDFARDSHVPCHAWGLAVGASDWTNNATYAAVANAPAAAWKNEAPGEVWLHEWLHGVCAHFARKGHAMPDGDADGADRHGYKRSPTTGWTDYYRDLMSGKVAEGDRFCGIPPTGWAATKPGLGRV